MKATSKQEFFDLLGAELNRIGIEDTNDIFADFEEHFTDGAMQGIPEDVTAERLGDIKEIARSYLNLESSRINSIMARDIEHRKVSLTKPGRGVPADLSLIGSGSAKEAVNSDNIREYTPEHYSSEIFPQSSHSNSVGGANSSAGASFGTSAGVSMGASAGTSSGFGMGAGAQTAGAAGGSGAGTGSAAGTADKTVADAFSDAGRAALDAAKLTGQVVADAFKQRGSEVKEAVTTAGKTAADAVKAAGDAVQRTVKSRTKSTRSGAKTNAAYNSAPRPSDSYRENMSTVNNGNTGSRRADIPPQHNKTGTKGGYKLIDVSAQKPNVNAGKLVLAILLDCLLWIWLLPALIGSIFGIIFGGAIGSIAGAFETFFGSEFGYHILISRLFLGFGFFWLGIAAVCVGVFFIRLVVKLIKFIINLHIKAIYDL